MTVSQLLQQSRHAHRQFHQTDAQHQGAGHWINGDQAVARQQLEDALRFRLEAVTLDPQFKDGAWAEDPVPHRELVAFYKAAIAARA